MNRLYFTILFLILNIFSIKIFAQIDQPRRAEIEINYQENFFSVVSAEENGLITFREKDDVIRNGNSSWEFIKYDTALNQEWIQNYDIAFDQEFIGFDYAQNELFLLFKKGPYHHTELKMIRIGLEDGDTSHYNIKNLIPLSLTDFNVVGNAALLSGRVNNRALVIHYDYYTKKLKVLPGMYKNHTEITEIKVDDKNKTFSIIMTERTMDRRNTVSTKTFDEKGELIQFATLSPDQKYNILYGRSTTFDDQLQFILGTYSFGNSNYSRGIYIAKLDEEGREEINHYNFGDLDNFFSYMKAKRQDRIKKRIDRRKIKGKKVKFNYRLLVHDIIEKEGKYIMLAEAYYPRYSNSNYFYGPGYNTFGRTRGDMQSMYFDGYKYTHAVVLGFDQKGKLLWDNSFEINDVISYNLEKFVNASVEKDKIVLLYLYENVVRSKIISNNKVLEGKAFNDIKLKFEDDVVKSNDNKIGGLEHWYGNNFFAYGVQTIRNFKYSGIKPSREVFFINKITYN